MLPIENLLSRLDKVKKQGKGWVACCPAHQDKSPSLGITEEADGKILLLCRAGCQTQDVLAAAGLEFRNLFPESGLNSDQKRIYAAAKRSAAEQALIDEELTIVKIARNRLSQNHECMKIPANQERYNKALHRLAVLGVAV